MLSPPSYQLGAAVSDGLELVFFLAVCAGAGAVIWLAAAQFAKGVREARDEYAARSSAHHRARSADQDAHSTRDQTSDRERSEREPDSSGSGSPTQWFDVLGVSEDASLDAIKTAYRHQIALYHPDRVASLGAELKAIAEIRTKEINSAYAFACRLKGRRS